MGTGASVPADTPSTAKSNSASLSKAKELPTTSLPTSTSRKDEKKSIPSIENTLPSIGLETFSDEAGEKPQISNNKLKKMALGIQGYKDKDRDYDQTLAQMDFNKAQKVEWSEPKSPEKGLATKSSKQDIAWDLKQESGSPSYRPYSNSRGADFSPMSTNILQPKSSAQNVMSPPTSAVAKPAASGPPPGLVARPFPGNLSGKGPPSGTPMEQGLTTPAKAAPPGHAPSPSPQQPPQYLLTPVMGPGNLPVRPFNMSPALTSAGSTSALTTSNKANNVAPMMMAIPPNAARGSAPVQVPVGGPSAVMTGLPPGAVPVTLGSLPFGAVPVAVNMAPGGAIPVLVPASPAGVIAAGGPGVGMSGPRGPPVNSSAPLPVVKETKDVKRNKAQLPSNLTHAKPTTGDWLNKRYIVNNYILLDVLGTGSYGEVRLCKDRTTERLYAIKIISKDFLKKRKNGKTTETYFEDIKREIAIMKKLLHPNILRLFEVLDDPKVNKMYLVLEYMKKGDLINILKKRDGNNDGDFQPLADLEVWHIFKQLVAGIRYLHFQNIVHGDIKPQNLLLGDDGIVKIADFGISQMLSGSDEQLHDAGGTPAFMAPELCEGKKNFSGQLADIWAMGASIFMLRFGHPPFVAKSIINLYYKICNDPLVFPSAIDPGLQNLIEGMLEKNPDKRLTIPQIVAHPWYRHPPAPPVSQSDNRLLSNAKPGTASVNATRSTANNTTSNSNNNNSNNNSSSTPSKTPQSAAAAAAVESQFFQPPPSYDAEADEAMKGPIHRTVLNQDEVFMSIGNISMVDEYEGAIGEVVDEEGDDDSDEEEEEVTEEKKSRTKAADKLLGRNRAAARSAEPAPSASSTAAAAKTEEARDKLGRKIKPAVAAAKSAESSDDDDDDEDAEVEVGSVVQKNRPTGAAAADAAMDTGGSDIMGTNWGADVFKMVEDDDKADDDDDEDEEDVDEDTEAQDRFDANPQRSGEGRATGLHGGMVRKESHSEMSEEEEARRSRRFMKKNARKSTENVMHNVPQSADSSKSTASQSSHASAKGKKSVSGINKSQSQPLTSLQEASVQQLTGSSSGAGLSSGNVSSSTCSSPLLKPGSRSARGDPTRTFSMNSTFDDDEPEALTNEEFQAMMDTLSHHNTQGSAFQEDVAQSSLPRNPGAEDGNSESKTAADSDKSSRETANCSNSSSAHNTLVSAQRHSSLTDQSLIAAAMSIVWEQLESLTATYVNQRSKVGGGFHSEQGIRPSQEDRCVLLPNVAAMQALAASDMNPGTREQLNMFALAGIFDGHDGWRASQYLSQYLATMLVTHDKFLDPKQLHSAINDTFTTIDIQLCDLLREEEDNSGSTAVVAVYDGRKKTLTVAGAGDSICVLCRNGHAIEMNKMHRIVDNASERDRVKNAGGKIINNRVNGVLAVSRSFGDTPFKTLHELQSNATANTNNAGNNNNNNGKGKGNNLKAKLPLIRLVNESLVTAVPEIYTEIITPQTEFALLASDGLWDVMTPQFAVSYVRDHLSRHKNVQKAAQEVVLEALRRGSIDNVTVLLLTFNIAIQQG